MPGGIRYRDKLNDSKVTTDESGIFSVTYPTPGMYWLHANIVCAGGLNSASSD